METEFRGDGAPTGAVGVTEAPAAPEPAVEVPGPTGAAFPLAAFAVIAGGVVALSVVAHAVLPALHPFHRHLQGHRWVNSFSWWDGWWYIGIARRGYLFFRPGRQSPVAFFPAYPLAMRYLGAFVGGPLMAGFVITLASGLGTAVLFHRWCVAKFGEGQARLAVLLLFLYPFAFYLMVPLFI